MGSLLLQMQIKFLVQEVTFQDLRVQEVSLYPDLRYFPLLQNLIGPARHSSRLVRCMLRLQECSLGSALLAE
jgi:hypothetical protein